ncbi:zinc finger domain-containing protein [Streptomyces sp. NPDC054871]
MTIRPGAPMPEQLRHWMRAKQHPARSVPCPHCGVAAHKPCRLRTRNQQMTEPHPQRVSAWAQLIACCPACQVTPEVPCHDEGRARATVHARRYEEAEGTAA